MSRLITIFGLAISVGVGFISPGCTTPADEVASVPFVGCDADQQGTMVAAPTRVTTIPKVPASEADKLAYYASVDLGVLGPRGWHCFGMSGSGGASLFVTPEVHTAKDLLESRTHLSGPVIELAVAFGDTSGRFTVAEIAARLFPVARPFVQQVIEGWPSTKVSFTPFPNDAVTRRSDTEVEFVTPANRDGLGTYTWIEKSDQPIEGVAILLPAQEMDLVTLDVRMPPEMRSLAPAIINAVERDRGRFLKLRTW